MEQQQLVQTLHAHGVRPTPQRLAVYEYLLEHRTHPSAETVYAALVKEHPTFSRTTVYNSLHALVEASLVQELSLDTEERHYDGDVTPHGHFLCQECHCIIDIFFDPTVLSALHPKDCIIRTQEVVFSGLCPACGHSNRPE